MKSINWFNQPRIRRHRSDGRRRFKTARRYIAFAKMKIDILSKSGKYEIMISQQILQGNWNEIKGRLRSKWGELTEDDVMTFNGNVDQLIGTIQKKTGEARENVEQFFQQFDSKATAAFNHVSESVRATANQAANRAKQASQQAAATMREGYAEVEGVVRRHPTESLVVCFGSGLIAGVVLSLLLRWR